MKTKLIPNARTQAVLDLMLVKEAKKELSKWRKSVKKMKRVDETELYEKVANNIKRIEARIY